MGLSKKSAQQALGDLHRVYGKRPGLICGGCQLLYYVEPKRSRCRKVTRDMVGSWNENWTACGKYIDLEDE